MLTEAEARNRAAKLAQSLIMQLGGEWKPVVWENLGWHYQASLGNLRIYPTRKSMKDPQTRYFASLGEHGGYSFWTESFHSEDPAEVAIRQLTHASRVVSQLINEHLAPVYDQTNLDTPEYPLPTLSTANNPAIPENTMVTLNLLAKRHDERLGRKPNEKDS